MTGRLVQTAMHLGFLLERQWPSYPKWLGSRFARLPAASAVLPDLHAALTESTWPVRQERLGRALTGLHELQRSIGLPSGTAAIEPFWDRPFIGVSDSVTQLLLGSITDPQVARLPEGVGAIEQWVDNAGVLTSIDRRSALPPPWASAERVSS